MNYSKVFISGGNGFIGRTLARYFKAHGVDVCGVDLTPCEEFNIVAGNLNEPASWRSLMNDCDLVIHTAAIVSNAFSYKQTWQANVGWTKNLLDAAVAANTVKRFIHISSTAVYGSDWQTDIKEDAPLFPDGRAYNDSKMMSEHLSLSYHARKKLNVTIIRPGDVYGPGSRPWIAYPLQEIAKGKFMVPEGMFGPVYIDDLVKGIYQSAMSDDASGEIFNLSGPEQVTNQVYFNYLAQAQGKNHVTVVNLALALKLTGFIEWCYHLVGKTTDINPSTMRMLSRKSAAYSNEKAQNIFGYKPEFTLQQGMQHALQWAYEQGLCKEVPRTDTATAN